MAEGSHGKRQHSWNGPVCISELVHSNQNLLQVHRTSCPKLALEGILAHVGFPVWTQVTVSGHRNVASLTLQGRHLLAWRKEVCCCSWFLSWRGGLPGLYGDGITCLIMSLGGLRLRPSIDTCVVGISPFPHWESVPTWSWVSICAHLVKARGESRHLCPACLSEGWKPQPSLPGR